MHMYHDAFGYLPPTRVGRDEWATWPVWIMPFMESEIVFKQWDTEIGFDFQTQGAQAIAYAQRYGIPISLLMFDIDHFKHINDTYGHEGGDNALKSISRYFLEAVRGADQPVARMGGEEFTLLLARAPLAEAVLVAERMRLAIERLEVAMPGNRTVHLSASLGVAQFRSEDADLNALMRRADQALYKAKVRGRNRVEAAD